MTNYERLRNQTMEEVARDRVKMLQIITGCLVYVGDFVGYTEFWLAAPGTRETAYAEALRLEMEWLMSEVGE